MRIIWLEEAERDLDRIVEYIAEDDPAAALSVLSTIREAPQVLLEHPRIGRPGRVEGTM
jgi:toxin ParE1/3/4